MSELNTQMLRDSCLSVFLVSVKIVFYHKKEILLCLLNKIMDINGNAVIVWKNVTFLFKYKFCLSDFWCNYYKSPQIYTYIIFYNWIIILSVSNYFFHKIMRKNLH